MARVVGLILAGGRSSRMGRQKALIEFHGRPLIAHAVSRARPQVDELLINANDAAALTPFGCEVVPDRIGGFFGPLAGVAAGLAWLRENRPEAEWLATFACDAPFFPADMVERLVTTARFANAPIAMAASGAQHHPVFALWGPRLAAAAAGALNEGVRKMDAFIARFPNVRVEFPLGDIDPFFNINTEEDLQRAQSFPPPLAGEVPSEPRERGGGGSD